jgi:hypothetical protein
MKVVSRQLSVVSPLFGASLSFDALKESQRAES